MEVRFQEHLGTETEKVFFVLAGHASRSPQPSHVGNILGAFWGHFGRHFWHVEATLGSLWNQFSYMMVTSWQLWGHFVVTIGI